MMYNQKMAVAIKTNGKVLREFNKDTVYIPFNSEFSVLIKNLSFQRALVNVYIDGENHTPAGLVINGHDEIDLERSIANGSLTTGNKFKFIERTGSIEQHRGVKLEDGLVRVEFQYEKPYVIPNLKKPYVKDSPSPWDLDRDNIKWSADETWTNKGFTQNITKSAYSPPSGSGRLRGMTSRVSINYSSSAVNDAGITVPGSHSSQSFGTTYISNLEEEKHSIILKLIGETADNKPIEKAVTVKQKLRCDSCGKHSSPTATFCPHCGTALKLYA